MTLAHYFASDIHLRGDHPERDARFRAFLSKLTSADHLTIIGDLCDFWMAARYSETKLAAYPSLSDLTEFRRGGGSLTIMAGNHDEWICPFYERVLGAQIAVEPLQMTIHGLRTRLVHGHRLGARRMWKAAMESFAFFQTFGGLPSPVAGTLDRVLAWKNQRGLLDDEERHLLVYRKYVESCHDTADLVVIGHVHRPVDDSELCPRMVVLGGWQYRSCYLTIDEQGARHHVFREGDRANTHGSASSPCQSS